MQTPKLRFKADDGSVFSDWTDIRFDNLYEPLNNNTFSRDCLNYEGGETKNIHYGDILIKFGEICDVQNAKLPFVNADNPVHKYALLNDRDIVLADTAEDETVGKAIEIYNTNGDKVISGLHTIACRPRIAFVSRYLGYYMNSYAYHSQLKPYMQGIKVTSIGRKNIAKTMIRYPSDKKEQQKIADFLSTIDTVIEKQQATVEAWEQRKKGVMQKLFNQEVRFKADDGNDFPDWEEKTLGNIFVERTERSVGGEELLSVTIAQGVIRQSDSDKRNNSSENKSNYKVVKKNDLAYNTMRMWQGAEGVSEYDGIVSPAYTIVTPKAGNNVKYFEIFFKQLSMLHLFQRYSQGLTSDTWNLKFPAFAKIKCQVPCEKEQDKIVNCISYLDDVIKKQKEILEKWQEFKKGLLQQMFV